MTDVDTDREPVDVTVVGAGQAGLSVAHHLRRRGVVGDRLRVVDAEDGPGGAWRHRWPTLTVERLNGIFELPDQQRDEPDPLAPANRVVPDWFARYEADRGLTVERPVEVTAVRDHPDAGDDRLVVESSAGTWTTRALVNCTGTWRRPHWPAVPGMRDFAGRQLHTHDYPGPEAFRDQRVVVVGGGISGASHVVELAEVATTRWVTRRPPEWREDRFDAEAGREVIERVQARVRRGLRTRSVVAETGLSPRGRFGVARDAGVLVASPMFDRLAEDGPVWDAPGGGPGTGWAATDAGTWPADVVLWATGFRWNVAHLAPLRLRTEHGGIRVEGSEALDDPRIHLVGYGPSASTVGANRYGRDAAIAITRRLRDG